MMQTWKMYLFVGLGGVIGTCLRYRTSLFYDDYMLDETFPWATLTVNISGAFLLSVLLFSPYFKRNLIIVPFLGTGVIGSFTTFSTIQLETLLLFEQHAFLALFYITVTIVGGIAGSFAGYLLSKFIFKKGRLS